MERLSLKQKAYEAIRHKIVSLELPPGAVIDESALIEELDVGRTPIREALQRLALEKLVVIVPRRGMFVTEIGITDLQRLFEVRLELEDLAARLATRRGRPEHWQRMEEVLAQLDDESEETDNEILITIDGACHEIMYEAADNEFLQDTLSTMYALSLRLWYYSLAKIGRMHSTVSEHREILEALKAGDQERAGALLRAHITSFQEEIQDVMLGTATPA
ncbi:MAG TPA: GntR family transcriptional regulator [Candidatus Sulfomarinibacteraceae bacterium]|nr:GntR family transcriptional regulator [Candidatus Sulfomarinibacteraceae bacterium]